MVACIDFFEMSEIRRPKFIVRHSTCVSYKDFCNLYLVVAFDVTKENDENLFSKTKSSELEVNWTLKDYQNVNYYTGCPRTGSPEKKGSLRANILTCILKKKSPISNDNREKTF
jgi:translation initiation factor 2 beta subunit (eIF-2beta)/eIF-5